MSSSKSQEPELTTDSERDPDAELDSWDRAWVDWFRERPNRAVVYAILVACAGLPTAEWWNAKNDNGPLPYFLVLGLSGYLYMCMASRVNARRTSRAARIRERTSRLTPRLCCVSLKPSKLSCSNSFAIGTRIGRRSLRAGSGWSSSIA